MERDRQHFVGPIIGRLHIVAVMGINIDIGHTAAPTHQIIERYRHIVQVTESGGVSKHIIGLFRPRARVAERARHRLALLPVIVIRVQSEMSNGMLMRYYKIACERRQAKSRRVINASLRVLPTRCDGLG
jgi:hypothetical protein